jgi:hypothetical protein
MYDAFGGGTHPKVRHRWAVNYTRNNLTEYDYRLAEIADRDILDSLVIAPVSMVTSMGLSGH